MGTSDSKNDSSRTQTSAKYDRAIALFSAEELTALKLIFNRICNANAESKESGFYEEDLKKYIDGRVPEKVGSKLFWILCDDDGKSECVSYEDFMVAIADLTKGMIEQQASILYKLVVSADDQFMSSFREIIEVFLECYEDILRGMQINLRTLDMAAARKVFVDMFMQDLQGGDIKCAQDLSTWLQNKPLMQTMLKDIMHYCFQIDQNIEEECAKDSTTGYTSSLLPTLGDVNWSQFKTLLNLPSILLINHQLPYNLRHTWRLLYAIDVHGSSFSTLVKRISLQGPSVLLVRDSAGHVFGGFASVSWHVGPNFIGSNQCFLFSLSPSMAIFESSSINEHYMYMNVDQETLPNGLGMGGQFGYFGLWLDQDFGVGHSKAHPRCITYDSTQLSASEQFTIDMLEVWAVGEPPKVPVQGEDGEQVSSILDKDPEAKALLDIIGKERKSEGLREDPTADIPEVHSLPPM